MAAVHRAAVAAVRVRTGISSAQNGSEWDSRAVSATMSSAMSSAMPAAISTSASVTMTMAVVVIYNDFFNILRAMNQLWQMNFYVNAVKNNTVLM